MLLAIGMVSPFDAAWSVLKNSTSLGGLGGMVGDGRSMVPRNSPMAYLMEERKDQRIPVTEEEILTRLQEEQRQGNFKQFNPDAQPTHEDMGGQFTHGFDFSARDAKRNSEQERQEQEAHAASQIPNSPYFEAQGKSWDPDMGRWV